MFTSLTSNPKHRNACFEQTFTPRDILGILYGHACGNIEDFSERCQIFDGFNTGECQFGPKQRTYLLDAYRKPGGKTQVREFGYWLVGAMLQALSLQVACASAQVDSPCPQESDPVLEKNLQDSLLAINKFLSPIPAAGFWVMFTYCLAQFLIVRGFVKHGY